MTTRPGRNAPCPCGSGKKYKKCCLFREAQNEQVDFKTTYRFEAGSYGDVGRFTPSLACLKLTARDQWQYHFVLVKPDSVHADEDQATTEAEHDMSEAHKAKAAGGSDADLALELRRRGYLSVDNYQIAVDGGFHA